MLIYISGKITGEINYKEKFDKAEQKLLGMGHIPLNPNCIILGLKYFICT